MAINNTVTPVPYDQALANLKKGGLVGSSLTQATNSLNNAYKGSVAPPVQQQQTTSNVKGLVSPTTPTPQSFSGLNTNLASAANPNNTQTGLIQKGITAAQGNTAIGQQAQDIANQYGQQIANVGGQGAKFGAGQLTTGTSPVAEGNAAITAQTTAQQQQALATGEQAALQGVGYQLTGQNQLQTGLNNTLGAANTQQAQQLTGLNEATGYLHPELGSIGQVPFFPGQQAQGDILGTQQPGGVQAAGQLLGQFSGAQAVGAAPGQTQATNYQTLGTAQTTGTAQGITAQAAAPGVGAAAGTQAVASAPGQTQAGQYGQIAAYKSAAQQGEQLASQLNDLLTKFNLNPSDINAVNSGIQKIAANTSDPRYQVLSNYLNDVASRYAQVLTPPGGSATDMTRSIAQSMINATASGKSIQQVLAALGQQAQAVISAVPASGTVPGANSQYQEGQTQSAGGYNFVYSNGKWVPK